MFVGTRQQFSEIQTVGVPHIYVLFQKLRVKDQLLQEAEKGEVFNGYYEGTLSFKPTYKYDIGSSIYDTSHKVSRISITSRC